jgi:hypothetical protein
LQPIKAVEGWGQTSNYNSDITAQVLHRQVAPWVLGQSADDIGARIDRVEAKEHKFPGSYRCRANAGLRYCALGFTWQGAW